MAKSNWSAGNIARKGIVMVSVFVLVTAAKGEWLLFFVHLGSDYLKPFLQPMTAYAGSNLTGQSQGADIGMMERLGLEGLHLYCVAAMAIGFSSFWGIGLSFDRYFFKNRKHVTQTWKCQPDRWLTPSDEWHEFILGSSNMLLASLISGTIACYIVNGGYNSLYTDISEYGLTYAILSMPAMFCYNEVVSYYIHRALHSPFLYKNVHKYHHRYGAPTLYSALAMHPFELLWNQSALALPVFLVPLHPAVFLGTLVYHYYYGMMEHSGIKMDSLWPWQPSSMFHDDHHRHFHCNFGFNSTLMDRCHGTLRKKRYRYGENVFGGGGESTYAARRSTEYVQYT